MLSKQPNHIVGIYLRLSKDDERAGESLSIENQRRILNNHIREQGWTIYYEYVDDGISDVSFDEHPNGNKTTCIVNPINMDFTPKSITSHVMLFFFSRG